MSSDLEQDVNRFELKHLLRGACFDHIAVVVPKCDVIHALFTYLGFDTGYARKAIGDIYTSMTTVVMQAPFAHELLAGRLQIALMSGNDGIDHTGQKIKSQISEYYARRGSFSVQHIAIRVHDITGLVRAWSNLGVQFITSDDNGPHILEDTEDNIPVLQCFTYPIIEKSGTFFELKQIVNPSEQHAAVRKEFRDRNVEGLWSHINRMIRTNRLFYSNIFDEPNLEESLRKRKVPIEPIAA